MSRGQEEALEQQKAESIKHDVLFFFKLLPETNAVVNEMKNT